MSSTASPHDPAALGVRLLAILRDTSCAQTGDAAAVAVMGSACEAELAALVRADGSAVLAAWQAQAAASPDAANATARVLADATVTSLLAEAVRAEIERVLGDGTRALALPSGEATEHPRQLLLLVRPKRQGADCASILRLCAEALFAFHERLRLRDALEQARAESARVSEELAQALGAAAHANTELAALRQRYHAIFELSPEMITLSRLSDGLMFEANQAFLDATGFAREQVIGRTARELGAWASLEQRVLLMADLERSRLVVNRQIDIRTRTGRVFPALFSGTVVELDGERCLVATGLDLTELHRAEAHIAEQNRQITAIYDAIVDGVVVVERDSRRIVRVNAAACMLFGRSAQELVGRTLDILHPESELSLVYEAFAKQARRQADVVYDLRCIRKDGTVFPVEIGARVVSFEGTPCMVGFFRDVSARKELEHQLLHAQKMESVGRLAGGVAHDFNNLLTCISGNVSLALLDLDAQHPLVTTLSEVAQAARAAAELTQQLLAFSRKTQAEPKVIELGSTLERLLPMMARIVGEHIALTLERADPPCWLRIDPGQLEQVVLNLVTNARDAMPRGGVITLRCERVEPSSPQPGWLRLSVRDSGVGMTPDVIEHLFEPFFTTKPLGRGTGLGLSTVYGIVTQAAGRVAVESAPMRGTLVRIELPEARAEATQAAATNPKLARGQGRILVVEDDTLVRTLAERVLQRAGYGVRACENAELALTAVADEGAFELLFTDVVMPGASGPELAAKLKQREPTLLVLFTSGHGDELVAHHGLLEPGSHFLAKPYSPQQLVNKVADLLRLR